MKTKVSLSQWVIASIVLLYFLQSTTLLQAQSPILNIITDKIIVDKVTYTGVKGANLRNNSGTRISAWDSTASFTVNYNAASTYNILRLTQFTVSSFTSSIITMPLDAFIKLRRSANPDVGDGRNYYNFWAQYSSIPAEGAASGTFNFTAPEVVNPEDAFLLNNLSSGYDNLFQNSLLNPHIGNIERVDFLIPAGMACVNDTERLQSGVAVIDRGVGDAFKIAAIKTLDASGNPALFGNLLTVTAASFGPDLLPASFNFCILINDIKYYSQSRPSKGYNQNLRGVYISIADLGIATGQRFFGYALFGPDVTVAYTDWTRYPNNSNDGNQLDPVNIMGFYKSPGSLLALPINFNASLVNYSVQLDFTLYNVFNGDHLAIEHSQDGVHFNELTRFYIYASGTYYFTDPAPYSGNNYYRLKMTDKSNISSVSDIRMVRIENNPGISIFPNPASDELNIFFPSSWTEEPLTAEIFTSTGQMVKAIQFDSPGVCQTINIASLLPGIYLLRLIKNKDLSGFRQTFMVK
jgi:hypothetical protein